MSNRIYKNTVNGNGYGLELNDSSGNSLKDNSFGGNHYNFAVWISFQNDVDESNKISGKPIVYWRNQREIQIPENAGYVALVGCSNIIGANLTLSGNGNGILLVSTSNFTLLKSTVSNNVFGVQLVNSTGCSVLNNTIVGNSNTGLLMDSASNNAILGNSIVGNDEGVLMQNANNNVLSQNYVADNHDIGVTITDSTNNEITMNEFSGNKVFAIQFRGNQQDNTIVLNNFKNKVSDLLQVSIDKRFGPGLSNVWDNGTAGNYWSEYMTRYLNASEIDHTGVGDTPLQPGQPSAD